MSALTVVSKMGSGLFLNLLVVLALGSTLVPAAHGQLYECDGRWTNKPCAGKVAREIAATSRPEKPVEKSTSAIGKAPEPLAPRYSLIRKLKKLNDEYVERGIPSLNEAELDGFESLCLDRSKPFVDCQSSFNEISNRLRELELTREANDLAAERNEIEQQKLDRRTGIQREGSTEEPVG